MKKIAYLLAIILVITSCVSSKKQLQKGNYDAAIEKSVKKLMKKQDNKDEILILDKAYNIANEQDLSRVKYLKLESNPGRWDEILNHYLRLKNRQTLVRTVLPLRMPRRTIDYEYFDYDREIVEAKHNAAEFFFVHGQKLMGNENKESYREAYYEFRKVKEYWGDYQNIDQLLNESHYLGMSRVLVTIENKTHLKLSEEFKKDLLAINHAALHSEWVEYHKRHLDEKINYDVLVYISLKIIDVSPELVKEKDYIEKKKVEDGFDYALDQNGNVMKDTAGNDIKINKYKELYYEINFDYIDLFHTYVSYVYISR